MEQFHGSIDALIVRPIPASGGPFLARGITGARKSRRRAESGESLPFGWPSQSEALNHSQASPERTERSETSEPTESTEIPPTIPDLWRADLGALRRGGSIAQPSTSDHDARQVQPMERAGPIICKQEIFAMAQRKSRTNPNLRKDSTGQGMKKSLGPTPWNRISTSTPQRIRCICACGESPDDKSEVVGGDTVSKPSTAKST